MQLVDGSERVCYLLFDIPLHAARRAMAATAGNNLGRARPAFLSASPSLKSFTSSWGPIVAITAALHPTLVSLRKSSTASVALSLHKSRTEGASNRIPFRFSSTFF